MTRHDLMRAAVLLVAAAAPLAGCDTDARPAPAAAATADPDRLSREHESCGASAHCGDGLRCFDQRCVRGDRSLLGDYHAARAAVAEVAGDLPRALEAYGAALAAYDADGVTVPADLECGYGAALAAGRADKERAELAARVLHRCVAAAPAGSAMRAAALRQAALLDEVGLDPAHLGREQPADIYLSRAPARPRTEDLKVTVSATPTPTAKGWPDTAAALQAASAPLIACWEANYDAKGEAALTVGVPMKSSYRDSGYDDEPSYYVTEIDPKAPAPASPAEACVRDVIAATVKGMRGSGSWSATVSINVQ